MIPIHIHGKIEFLVYLNSFSNAKPRLRSLSSVPGSGHESTFCVTLYSVEKLLGLTLDRRLNFKNHVSNLCKKACQKIHALARVSKYMEKSKLELTMTSFVLSHFSYFPLVWMSHDRKSYNKIDKIHERAPRILHKDSTSNFESLLIKSDSVSIHQRNLQLLLIEIYKTVNNLKSIFHGRSIYNQRCAV